MSTTKKPPTKKGKKVSAKTAAANRNEVYIRISDIPDEMFEAIVANAEIESRSNGAEVLSFLKKNKYK